MEGFTTMHFFFFFYWMHFLIKATVVLSPALVSLAGTGQNLVWLSVSVAHTVRGWTSGPACLPGTGVGSSRAVHTRHGGHQVFGVCVCVCCERVNVCTRVFVECVSVRETYI